MVKGWTGDEGLQDGVDVAVVGPVDQTARLDADAVVLDLVRVEEFSQFECVFIQLIGEFSGLRLGLVSAGFVVFGSGLSRG